MKEKLKSFFVNVLLVSIISYGIVYWANITSTTQTAVTWDIITASWVNAVNTKLNSLSTGWPWTVVAWCYYNGQSFYSPTSCWWGATSHIVSWSNCPAWSTTRGVDFVYDWGESSGTYRGSFICVKN
jgi:hypothetical protein